MRTCGYCGVRNIPDSARAHAKFCSSKCRVYSHRAGGKLAPGFRSSVTDVIMQRPLPERVEGACAVCGGSLSGRQRVSCSTACANRLSYMDRRARHSNAVRIAYSIFDVFERDGWVCQICFGPVDKDLRYPHELAGSLDHVVPLSQGGDDVPDNVQLSHFRCNWAKGAKA